jgi:hypothetical protein
MRLSIALGALAGGLTLGWAMLAEAADQGPPPAAPIFYCPSAPAAHGAAAGAPAAPQACPAPAAHRHAVIEHRRVEPRRERVIVRRERPDEDVSASQAFIYRYEEARHGLNAEAADDAWRHEPPVDHRVHERLYTEEAPPPCPGQAVDHCPIAPVRDAPRAHVYVEPPPPPPPPVMVRAQPQAPAPVYVQVAPTPPTEVYVHLAPAAPPQVYVEHERERPSPPAYYYERPACPDVPRDRCPLANEQGPWNEPAYAEAPPPHRELPPPPAYVEREQYAPRPGYVERERDVTMDRGGYAYERSESEQSSGWRYSDDNGQVRSEHWRDGDRDGGRHDDGRRDGGCPNSCSGSAYQQGEWRDGSYGAVAQYSGRDSYGYLVWPGKTTPEQ